MRVGTDGEVPRRWRTGEELEQVCDAHHIRRSRVLSLPGRHRRSGTSSYQLRLTIGAAMMKMGMCPERQCREPRIHRERSGNCRRDGEGRRSHVDPWPGAGHIGGPRVLFLALELTASSVRRSQRRAHRGRARQVPGGGVSHRGCGVGRRAFRAWIRGDRTRRSTPHGGGHVQAVRWRGNQTSDTGTEGLSLGRQASEAVEELKGRQPWSCRPFRRPGYPGPPGPRSRHMTEGP